MKIELRTLNDREMKKEQSYEERTDRFLYKQGQLSSDPLGFPK